MRTGKLASEAVEDAAGACGFREALLFLAKFAGMRNHAAARAASGMLDMQHLVEQNVFHSACRNAGTIHAAIQKDLIWAGIVTTKLPPPDSRAPSDVRAAQLTGKVFSIQLIEKTVQIEMVPARVRRCQANAPAAHAVHAGARAIGARIFQVRFGEFPGRLAAIHARQQQSGRSFQDGHGGAPQEVGEIALARVVVHRRKGSPECGRDAGMCWRNIDADDSAVHLPMGEDGSLLQFGRGTMTADD